MRPLRCRYVVVLAALLLFAGAPFRAGTQVVEGYASGSDVDLYYRALGAGRPILLINGGPGWSSDHMLPVARRLADSHRVIMFDQRGTGRSSLAHLDSTTVTLRAMVADIEALRRRMGVARWVVMGHSFGAMLAMAYTSAHREQVGALVLSAPGGATLDFMQYYPASLSYRLTPDERAAAIRWSDARLAAPTSRKTAYELIRASLGAFLYDRSHLDSALAVLDENTWSLATSELVWADLTRIDFDIRSPLREFDGPVLVVQGRQDALGDLHAFQIAQLFRHGKLEIIEEAAHLLWVDQKERYYEILQDFLGRIPEDAWKDS